MEETGLEFEFERDENRVNSWFWISMKDEQLGSSIEENERCGIF